MPNPHNTLELQVWLSPFTVEESSKKLSNLPKITQAVSGRAWLQNPEQLTARALNHSAQLVGRDAPLQWKLFLPDHPLFFKAQLKSAPSMKSVFWVFLPCGTLFVPSLGFCQTMINGGTWVRPTYARTSALALEGGCHLISIAASPSPRRASTNVHWLKQWWTLRWWRLSEEILGTRARSTLSWVLGG